MQKLRNRRKKPSILAEEEGSKDVFVLVSIKLEHVVIISDLDDIIVEISLVVFSIIEVLLWDRLKWGVAVSFLVADWGVVMLIVDVELIVVVVLSVTKFDFLQKW